MSDLTLPPFEGQEEANLPSFQGLCSQLTEALTGIVRHPDVPTQQKEEVLNNVRSYLDVVLSSSPTPSTVVSKVSYSVNWEAVTTLDDLKALLEPLNIQYTDQCPTLERILPLIKPNP